MVPGGSIRASANAAASAGRSSGRLASPAMTVVRSGSGTASGRSGAGWTTCARAVATTDSPWNGRVPVNSSYPTTASE